MKTPISPILLTACLLSGCISPAPKNAEVTIPVPKAKAREGAVNFLVSQQWHPVRSDDLVMVFEKQGTAHDIMFMADGGGAKHQLTLTFMDQTNAVRLLGFGARVYARAGVGQQTYTHLDIHPGIVWHLEGIRATCLGEPLPQLPPPPPPAESTKGARK